LITSLAQYSEGRQPDPIQIEDQKPTITRRKTPKYTFDKVSSTLFLQIYAAADFYTMNQTLMESVPPVYVDIILDPYIFNVFPRSLVPTAGYIVILAIVSWYLSKSISIWVQNIPRTGVNSQKKKA
jgi:hypothetical protein